MPAPVVLHRQNYKRSAWKNGLGFTDEIAIYPPEAALSRGDFLWRLSSARIEKASPFSVFSAHDRVLVVLKGGGMRLTHVFEEGEEGETVDLPPLEPYEFPGDVPSSCELPNGPVTDFSVFVRKAEMESSVRVLRLHAGEEQEWGAGGRWNFAFLAEGSVESDAGFAQEGETLSWERSAADPLGSAVFLRASGQGATLLLVSLG